MGGNILDFTHRMYFGKKKKKILLKCQQNNNLEVVPTDLTTQYDYSDLK